MLRFCALIIDSHMGGMVIKKSPIDTGASTLLHVVQVQFKFPFLTSKILSSMFPLQPLLC